MTERVGIITLPNGQELYDQSLAVWQLNWENHRLKEKIAQLEKELESIRDSLDYVMW